MRTEARCNFEFFIISEKNRAIRNTCLGYKWAPRRTIIDLNFSGQVRYPTRLLSYSPRYKCTSVEFLGSTKKYVNNLRAEHLEELNVVSIHRVIKRKIKRIIYSITKKKNRVRMQLAENMERSKRSAFSCTCDYIPSTYTTFSDGGGW